MTKKQFEKIIAAQKKKSAELLDLAMTCVCDTVCKYPVEGLSADEFDRRCEICNRPMPFKNARKYCPDCRAEAERIRSRERSVTDGFEE